MSSIFVNVRKLEQTNCGSFMMINDNPKYNNDNKNIKNTKIYVEIQYGKQPRMATSINNPL